MEFIIKFEGIFIAIAVDKAMQLVSDGTSKSI